MSEDRAPVAYEHRQLHCGQCGRMLMLAKSGSSNIKEIFESPNCKWVPTQAEVLAGANVTCECGTVSFCQPMIPARTVK